MAHHQPTFLIIIGLTAISLCVHGQFQFLHRPIRPLYFVHKSANQPQPIVTPIGQQINKSPINFNRPPNGPATSQEDDTPEFTGIGRADLAQSSSEEEDQNDNSGENPGRRNGTALPPNFDASVRANRPPLEPRPRRPMYGDPAVMEDDDEEQDRSRYLWPFSTTVTVSKTKKGHHGHGLGPPPHLTYHDYVEQMYNTAHGIHEPHHHHHHEDKYLTNEEILHSKGSRPPPPFSPNQKISSPSSSSSWGLSLPSLSLRGGLLSRLLSAKKDPSQHGPTIGRHPPPQPNSHQINRLRTEGIDRDSVKTTKATKNRVRNRNKGNKVNKVKNRRNKEDKKEKVKKTIYSILLNTMNALDKEKDD